MEHSQKIGLGAATFIGVNAMIGAGVVAIPAILAGKAGLAGIFAYGISVPVALFVALAFGRLASCFPASGWSYEYPARWGGHFVGLFSAWAYAIGVLIAMGFLAQEAGKWLVGFIPIASPGVLAVGVMGALTLLVIAGAHVSSIGQYLIGICVVVPLVLIGGFCWTQAQLGAIDSFAPYGWSAVLSAVPATLFSFFGLEAIISLYPIVRSPSRLVPLATIFSVLIVSAIYVLFASGIIVAIPSEVLSQAGTEPLSRVLANFFPTRTVLATILNIGALFAIVGTLHSMIWSLSQLVTDVLARFKTKAIAELAQWVVWQRVISVLLTSIIITTMAFLLKAEIILNVAVMCITAAYGLAIAALLGNAAERQSWHIVIPIAALGGCGFIFYWAARFCYCALSQV